MADPPQELKVLAKTDKGVVIDGQSGEWGIVPKEAKGTLDTGDTFKGWLNPDGQYGPYVKVAEERGGGGGGGQQTGGGDDPMVRASIERQTAIKAAAEITAALVAKAPDWPSDGVGDMMIALATRAARFMEQGPPLVGADPADDNPDDDIPF